MKRGWLLIGGFFALLLLINFYPEIKIENRGITGRAIEGEIDNKIIDMGISGKVIFIPSVNSNTEIQNLWDSVFKESSSGIIIFTNNSSCGDKFVAFKNTSQNELYMIFGGNCNASGGFEAHHLNFNESTTTNLSTINSFDQAISITIGLLPRTLNIVSPNDANLEFVSVFKETPLEWTLNSDNFEFTNYTYFSNSTLNLTCSGVVYNTESFEGFSVTKRLIPSCTPSWTAKNTTCANETIITWYNDTNSCGNLTGRPENTTLNCDSDGNGLIGSMGSITESNFQNLKVLIADSELNVSKIYNGTRIVEIEENGTLMISFNHNFSIPLDLKKIIVKKQPSNFKYGYLIVNGIHDNKTFFVDRKNGTGGVCVKNSEISSIDSISNDCDEANEYYVSCPGAKSGFSCNITGNFFQVSGLTNSAVKESTDTSLTICTPSWNCTNWSVCEAGLQVRNCTDTKSCGSLTGRILNQSCSVAQITQSNCISNWTCGAWLPEECPESGNRTRTCTDNNNCAQRTKTENQSCKYSPKTSIWIFVLLGTIITAAIIVIIFIVFAIKRNQDFKRASQPFSPQPPTMAPPSPPSPPSPATTPNLPPITRPIPSELPKQIVPKSINPALQLQPMAPRMN
jgi:hypothetical protein